MSENTSSIPWKMILIVVAVALITTLVTGLLLFQFLFPKRLRPVSLNAKETQVLEQKMEDLTGTSWKPERSSVADVDGKNPIPEPYKEDPKKREIKLSQREVNALVAKNTEFGERIAIHLGEDAMSAKMLIPVDPDFPFIGGKTLKAAAGLELAYHNQKPVVILKGVSFWGVPIPNAWLGGLKNIDLVKEFGGSDGFWKSFSDGLEYVKVENGQIHIKLKQ
jgi:hypothetical protein